MTLFATERAHISYSLYYLLFLVALTNPQRAMAAHTGLRILATLHARLLTTSRASLLVATARPCSQLLRWPPRVLAAELPRASSGWPRSSSPPNARRCPCPRALAVAATFSRRRRTLSRRRDWLWPPRARLPPHVLAGCVASPRLLAAASGHDLAASSSAFWTLLRGRCEWRRHGIDTSGEVRARMAYREGANRGARRRTRGVR